VAEDGDTQHHDKCRHASYGSDKNLFANPDNVLVVEQARYLTLRHVPPALSDDAH
jgi:hypothetical protein